MSPSPAPRVLAVWFHRTMEVEMLDDVPPEYALSAWAADKPGPGCHSGR
jgi:hypothetical protein